jgi:hypothetical protein
VMRDIIGNHIATVSEGRIGSAAVIGDSAVAGLYSRSRGFPLKTRSCPSSGAG